MLKKVILVLAATFASSWSSAGLLISNKPNQYHQIKDSQSPKRFPAFKFNDNPLFQSNNISCCVEINSVIYIGTSLNGLWQSLDNGATFTQNKQVGTTDVQINFIKIINSIIYVGTNIDGLWQSTDEGKTFIQNSQIPNEGPFGVNFINLVNNTIFVGTTHNGLYQSTDGGNTFIHNISISVENASVKWIKKINKHIYVSIMSSLGPESGLYQSTDDGKTFQPNTSIPFSEFIPLIIQINQTIYVGTQSMGLWQSTNDGKTFIQNNQFPDTTQIQKIVKLNNIIYVGTGNGLYKSTDEGKTFTQNKQIMTTDLIITINQTNGIIFIGTSMDGLYTSIDDGKTFIQNSQIPNNNSINFLTKISHKICVGTSNGLYESNPHTLLFINSSVSWNYNWIDVPERSWPVYEIDANADTLTFDQSVIQAQIQIDNNPSIEINPKNPYILKNTTSKPQVDYIRLVINPGEDLNYSFLMEGTNGLSTLTFQKTNLKSPKGNPDYDLDLYINKNQVQQLINDIRYKSKQYYSESVLRVLTTTVAMGDNPWKNFWSVDPSFNLQTVINSFGKEINPHQQSSNLLYNFLTVGDSSVLNHDGQTTKAGYDQFRQNLVQNLITKNNNGVILRFVVSWDGGAWHCNNFDDANYIDAYNNIVISQNN